MLKKFLPVGIRK